MLSRFNFFLIRNRRFFSGGGGGAEADYFQQLKLDFFTDKVKVYFFVIQLPTIAIRPYTLV